MCLLEWELMFSYASSYVKEDTHIIYLLTSMDFEIVLTTQQLIADRKNGSQPVDYILVN